jgi:voltage-gated potassium channel
VAGKPAVKIEDQFMNERAKRIEQAFEWPMVIAALLVIPVIWIETAEPGQPLETIGDVLNWLTWGAFLTELVVMLYVSPRPSEWLKRHPLDAVVVVVSPPFIPSGLAALRLLRLGRVLRLVRLLSLKNLLSLEGIRYAAFLTLFVILLGGAAYASVESTPNQDLSAWDGVWWAVNTVTTVGNAGAPKTTEGRVIAMSVMAVGIGFVALLTAYVADRFVTASREAGQHEAEVTAALERIEERLDRLEQRR